MSQFTVDDIQLGEHDANHRRIVDVYAKQSMRYAVYQTEKRVVIAFADDPLVQKIQRKRLAPLAVLRSEIDGMLAPWREKAERFSRLSLTARQYDMRVASALIEALEGEAEAGRQILEEIRSDIAGEMASRARLAYVVWSLASAATVFVVGLLIHAFASGRIEDFYQEELFFLFAAMSTGILGALYSIAMRIEQRALKDDLRRLDHITDSLVRLGLGAMGAFVIGCFLVSGAIELNFGSGISPGADGEPGEGFIFVVLIAGFLAGFSERLVPDLLNSYTIVARKDEAAARPRAGSASVSSEVAPGATAGIAGAAAEVVPDDEDEVTNQPSEEEDVDGCDVALDDPELATSDEDLPPSSGGVARQ